MTELQNYRFTELQINRQGKSSIAPTFSKRGYMAIITELQIYRITDLQNYRQGKSSIAPTFSKRGYNECQKDVTVSSSTK